MIYKKQRTALFIGDDSALLATTITMGSLKPEATPSSSHIRASPAEEVAVITLAPRYDPVHLATPRAMVGVSNRISMNKPLPFLSKNSQKFMILAPVAPALLC